MDGQRNKEELRMKAAKRRLEKIQRGIISGKYELYRMFDEDVLREILSRYPVAIGKMTTDSNFNETWLSFSSRKAMMEDKLIQAGIHSLRFDKIYCIDNVTNGQEIGEFKYPRKQ